MRAKVGRKHACATPAQLAKTERMFVRMLRQDAVIMQKCRCVFCKDIITFSNATADHLLARSRGGSTDRKNIKAACEPCNKAKSNGADSWFRKVLHDPQLPDGDSSLTWAWIRFRLNRRTEKAERRIKKLVGMQ